MSNPNNHGVRKESSAAIELELNASAATVPTFPAVPSVSTSDEVTMSRTVALKIASCCFSFFCAGVDLGSLGTLLPYFRESYGAGLGSATIVYAASFAGWCLAGAVNGLMLRYVSFGGILIAGASMQLLAQAVRCWSPPFSVYCLGFFFSALGTSFQDSQCNTYISSIKATAHRWLGVIHAIYSVGNLVAPFAANTIAARNPAKWSYFYFLPLCLNVLNMGVVMIVFRDSMRKPPTSTNSSPPSGNGLLQSVSEKFNLWAKDSWTTLKEPGVWQLSLFFFLYTAAATTSNGWLVEFLVTVRGGDLQKMGYAPIAAYGGAIIGRFLLPDVFARFGERRMVFTTCFVYAALQLTVWLVPNIPVNIAAMGIMGIIASPFFPVGISVGSKLFARQNRAAALGFLFIAAQAGGALLPSLTGIIAQRVGSVRVLQPIVVGLICTTAAAWILVPRPPRREE